MIASEILSRGIQLTQRGVPGKVAARVAFFERCIHLPQELTLELWSILGTGEPPLTFEYWELSRLLDEAPGSAFEQAAFRIATQLAKEI